jgi:hypothetical protein
VTGRVATAALYASELGAGGAGQLQLRLTEQQITSSLDRDGYRRDAPSADLLCRLRGLRRTVGSAGAGLAVVTSEHALARYSAGLPTANPTAAADDSSRHPGGSGYTG